ncbi:MAG: hypothetical protein NXI08_11560 [bacterium]|nr:hypothetical protein [bacterium]
MASLPKEIIEWAIWGHLDREKNVELILLKGHLYLDLVLNSIVDDMDLSFYGRIKKYQNMGGREKVTKYLFEVNKMRNELAHEYKFSISESGLINWTNNVLNDFDTTYFTRRTYRTKIVHAFSTLAKEIVVMADYVE